MKRACVIGWPIEHSRSPLIHQTWLERYKIDGTYTKQAVNPAKAQTFFSQFSSSGLVGCNVTVPLKELAFQSAQYRDGSAIAVSAANTLWLEAGKLCAMNTDTYGFMTHLGTTVPDWQKSSKPIAILGAGGAARAICYGFIEAGVEAVWLFNRTRARAEELARDLGSKLCVKDWNERIACAQACSVIVNTTTIGMNGVGDLGLRFHNAAPECVVSDIVYAPLETSLLRAAKLAGLRTVDGLGMLLHQAVPGFEKWFGVRPEVTDDLRDKLVEEIEKHA